jgi:hypothetical protein
MGDFFTRPSKQQVDAKAHGMKWSGPPLDLSWLVGYFPYRPSSGQKIPAYGLAIPVITIAISRIEALTR